MASIPGTHHNSQGAPEARELQPLTNVSVFRRDAYSKSWGRPWSASFLEIPSSLYLHTMEPKSGTPHFTKVPKRLSVMFVCLFFWKNFFVMFMWTAIDQNLFGKKLLCKKQWEMLIVSSSGTKAAFKYLWIFYLNVWMNSSRLLGTLACLNNCQCSGRYPTKSGVWIANIWTAVLMEAWSTVEVAV